MATVNTTATLAGLFKEVYGTSIVDLVPNTAKLAKRFKFSVADQIGKTFNFPVEVQNEHSFAYAASGTTPTLATLNSGQMQNVAVQGAQIVGRAQVDYEAIAKSAAGGKVAFAQATKNVVARLARSAAKRLEIQILHGQRGLGTFTMAAETGSYVTVMTITDADWSAGIWAGMVGATLDLYSAPGGTLRNNVVCTISAVDIANKKVTITYASTARASWTSAPVDGDTLFFAGASASTEFAGIDLITRNTGTLFGVDAAVYESWGSNVYSTTTGVPSMAKLLEALSMCASFSLEEPALAIVSPKGYEVLNSDAAALRMFDSSYGGEKGSNGFKTLQYIGQTGALEIMAHPFQKDGLIHIVTPSETKRIGATDLDFISRHGDQERLIIESATVAASEMRVYSHQALLLEAPRHAAVLAGCTF
jgi:hypothetical protein